MTFFDARVIPCPACWGQLGQRRTDAGRRVIICLDCAEPYALVRRGPPAGQLVGVRSRSC